MRTAIFPRDLTRGPGLWVPLVVAVHLLGPAGSAHAADPVRSAQRCREVIADNVRELTARGLHWIDGCHRRRNRKGPRKASAQDCNRLPVLAEAEFKRNEERAKARINFYCREILAESNPVIANYPGGSARDAVVPEVRRLLETSSQDIQGAPALSAEAEERRRLRRCHRTISEERSAVIMDQLRRATRCQRRLDGRTRKAVGLGPLDPPCVSVGGKRARRAADRTEGRCRGLEGTAVGSCASIPGCVVENAVSTGQSLARAVYGGPTQCGNGVLELGEQCDDGNTFTGDACTATCEEATCGDGIVWEDVEECDDGNQVDDDGCDRFCAGGVCGDGERTTDEECDDGNGDDGDGCSADCLLEPIFCGPGGIGVTIALAYDRQGLGPIGGALLRLRYPPFLSLPGRLFQTSVRERIEDLTGGIGSFLPSDQDADGDGTDETLQTLLANSGPIPPGLVQRVSFDNDPGTGLVPTDLSCALADVVDPLSNAYDPNTVARFASCVIEALECLEAAATTTTTSTPSTSTSVTVSTLVQTTTTTSTTSTTTSTSSTTTTSIAPP